MDWEIWLKRLLKLFFSRVFRSPSNYFQFKLMVRKIFQLFSWFKLLKEAVTQRCSVNKVFLEISQESTCARVSFLIKLQAEAFIKGFYWGPFIKKETLAQVFFSEFLKEHLRWLLLYLFGSPCSAHLKTTFLTDSTT